MLTPRATRCADVQLACACVLTLVLGSAPNARAVESTNGPVATDPVPSVQAAHDAIRYRVDVTAPADMAAVLATSVELIRWQDFPDMTEDLLAALMHDASAQAKEAAAALGYFSAEATLTVDRAQTPVSIALRVVPGPPTRVRSVRIVVTGPAENDTPLGTTAIATTENSWTLRQGEVFTQAAWASAKRGVVATLAASAYAAARLTDSEARVDPDSASADLRITLDSGPAFHIGDIEIRGLVRYSPELVRNFSTFKRGAPFSEAAVDDYVRRLLVSGYFASVQATLDTEASQTDDATLTLSVIESLPKRLEGGLGYSTDTEFRASANYSDVNIDGKGLQFYADARLESKLQSFDLRLVQPPAEGWRDSYEGAVERTDIEGLIARTASVVGRRQGIDERNTPAFSAGFYFNDQQPSGGELVSSHALYVDAQYTWRRTDELLSPTRGWMANVQAGAGIPGASTKGFGRLIGKAAYWLPLSRDTSLYMRAEGGAVLADSRDGIPSVFLFRTGGDTTVRGYAFESLGVQQDNAIVGGRYYAVTSAEVTRWITPVWGLATFVDAGNATDTLDSFSLKLGYGVGVRVRTPIGPFRLDLAYGQATKQVRVHFSVGLSF